MCNIVGACDKCVRIDVPPDLDSGGKVRKRVGLEANPFYAVELGLN